MHGSKSRLSRETKNFIDNFPLCAESRSMSVLFLQRALCATLPGAIGANALLIVSGLQIARILRS